MDTDTRAFGDKSANTSNFRNSIQDFEIMNLLISTICEDNEKIFQDNEKIDHIYNGINLVRSEAVSLYLMILQHCYLDEIEDNLPLKAIEFSHLFAILKLLVDKPVENIFKNDDLNRIACIIHDLYSYFNTKEINDQTEIQIIHSFKEIGNKLKTNYPELVVKICHILT